MTKKKTCLYYTIISARGIPYGVDVSGVFNWSVENKAKETVERNIKEWVKSIRKPTLIIKLDTFNRQLILYFKGEARKKGREGVLEYAKEFKKIIREAIREAGYKPKIKQ